MLDDDDQWRAAIGAAVRASEMPFGQKNAPAVEIAVAAGRVRMRGSADKVDVARDGTIHVTDIKTGSKTRFAELKNDPVAGGTKLQLPAYAAAARARFGNADTPVEAHYWFVRKDAGQRITIPLTDEVERIYAHTVGVLVESIARGLFPVRPPKADDYAFVQCGYCNPDGVGYGDNRAAWERKRVNRPLRTYVELVEPDALTEDET
jgi:hypothetical protein